MIQYTCPNECQKRSQRLYDFQVAGLFSDFSVLTSDHVSFEVHKNILAAGSDHFKLLLESQQELTVYQLPEEKNIKKADLDIIVKYLYLGATNISPSNALNIYEKCEFLQIRELQVQCYELLKDNIANANCLTYWKFSEKYGLGELKARCIEFAVSDLNKFFDSYLSELSFEEVKAIIFAENLEMEQELLFTHIISWVNYDVANRNCFLKQILHQLDFKQFSTTFILEKVLKEPLMQTYAGEIYKKLLQILEEINDDERFSSRSKACNKIDSLISKLNL